MPTYTLTPEQHPIFNEFDQHGLLLGLSRLENEKNAKYKQRLMDVMVHRAGSSYQGLINGITRELGLKIVDVMLIEPVLDINGDPLVPNPGVVFQETKCTLYNDFTTDDVLLVIDRFEPLGGSFTLATLADTINATGYYTATLLYDANENARSMTIFNQTSIGIVPSEDISGKGLRVRLDNVNLIPGTISVTSPNLIIRKSSPNNLGQGEYYVDEVSGTVFTNQVPADGSLIRYKYRNDSFVVQASPVILHNLQSADFKTKMFEQIGNGEPVNGLPTHLGADIINELLSVFPSNWGV